MEDGGPRLIITLLAQVQPGHERPIRPEARVESLRSLQPSEKQSGGDEQRQTYRYLSNDQQIAQPRARRGPLPNTDALFLESRGEIGFGGLQRRRRSKGQAGQYGDKQGVAEDTDVGADIECEQYLIEPCRRD